MPKMNLSNGTIGNNNKIGKRENKGTQKKMRDTNTQGKIAMRVGTRFEP